MNRDEILVLEGRELDAKVAEVVFGWGAVRHVERKGMCIRDSWGSGRYDVPTADSNKPTYQAVVLSSSG